MPTEKRNDVLSLLGAYRGEIMGFFALWIWFFHLWTPIAANLPVLSSVEAFLQRIGFTSVDVFFFLSGMGMIYAISKHSTLEFYKRRLLRVYLPFFITSLLQTVCYHWGIRKFIKAVTGYGFYFDPNQPQWFAPAILTLYLFFPLYHRFFQRSKIKGRFIGITLLVWLLLSLGLNGTLRRDLYGFTNRIPVFLIGVWFGWLSKTDSLLSSKRLYAACTFALLIGLILIYLTSYRDLYLLVPASNCCIPTLLLAVSLSLLLSAGLGHLSAQSLVPAKPILAFLRFYGTISLEFYCVQELFGGRVRDFLLLHLPVMPVNLIVFAACTLGAALLSGVCALIRRLVP